MAAKDVKFDTDARTRMLRGVNILALLTLALDKTVNSDLYALPALVTVHGVVAADGGSDLTILALLEELLELLGIASGRAGRSVATIAKEVDVDVRDTLLLGGLEESLEVVDVRVDTTVGDLRNKCR